ncbi:MAG: hypothetical protein HC802_13080 [Caldilineaceae bacterium]|nr:hypothetical protein [Caldilineaceae bacterium]
MPILSDYILSGTAGILAQTAITIPVELEPITLLPVIITDSAGRNISTTSTWPASRCWCASSRARF